MKDTLDHLTSRREFLKSTSRVAAASALAGVALPHVHAADDSTLQLALIGCGGRGTGAIVNALATRNQGPIKLVAMADVFKERLDDSYRNLSRNHAAQMDVPPERRFIGFDAYKKAMDCLKPGDIMVAATPPAFRWVHFTYAIQKGLHAFMEKPVTVDGPTSRRMFELGEAATKKNLKVGIGLMSRHSRHLAQLAERVHNGEIGDIILQRGYRMHGPVGFFASVPKPAGVSDLMYQVQRFHSFIWASGGNYSDFYIHIIDHLGWIKNAWPVKAQALGGRHYRQSPEGVTYVDQNFDTYAVEYTYADGTKFDFDGRCMTGCMDQYHSYIHGTKGSAIASKNGDCGGPSTIFKGQTPRRSDMLWESKVTPGEEDPYQNEWNDLINAIRNDKPYNEVKHGVEASAVTSMGRMAAHTGQEITYEDFINGDHEMAPGLDQLTESSEAPLKAGPDGRYPVPEPGRKRTREY
ncbi:MAG: Gfo/Idh/MocA family oxidoreductase [Verrucomicrobia bacterium]|jgi:predicted dehydrogenase|nr:Gfo/Idh/MocA family oxidoreductase [Verrucomicrobiota bacterium]OQC70721.1 MAG: Inositol 2-dehydrogenase/D-chiro-inositol 3-dehydrogenase [candidate division Hyd24-12 bacterium ADurb.Bin004]MDI9382398.1 Gfo/Idh/MocA family oxidoreductase [Verrucomicrobiota bacterium]NMD20566.1 Gfo/Idh/MocA family oxidoreductase [Verrucomicrobiota bacterium]HNU99122.1 Gfo/Idh/MocA family oxidoreductase [Verrucomicrobiota bacterium]